MSANDPLKRGQPERRLRALSSEEHPRVGAGARRATGRAPILKCSYRPPDADFYCWKFGVWYNLGDCSYRHAFSTFWGCADCGQGASNLKARRRRINLLRAHAYGR
jgi:hypothetical protein